MSDQTIRDRALAGEVVKVTDERLAEMQRIAIASEGVEVYSLHWHWVAAINELIEARKEIERLTARVAELEKERDASAEDARAMQERLQRAVQGAMTLRRALDIIVNIRPLGAPTYPECYSRMRAVALDALGDDGPPGPKHPPRVPGHNPVA